MGVGIVIPLWLRALCADVPWLIAVIADDAVQAWARCARLARKARVAGSVLIVTLPLLTTSVVALNWGACVGGAHIERASLAQVAF